MAFAQPPVQRAQSNAPIPRNTVPPLSGYTMMVDRPQPLATPMVSGPPMTVYTSNVPVNTLKRKGVDGVGGRFAGGRARADFGGSPDAEIALIRRSGAGRVNPPPFAHAYPSLTGWRPADGAPLMSGIPNEPVDSTVRGITPIGPRPDAEGWMWNGMPTAPDSYFQGYIGSRPNVGPAINQAPIGPFNMPGARQGLPGGDLYPWETAADRAKTSFSDDSGSPNPRVKYTFLLSKKAAAYALTTMAYQPLFGIRDTTPIDESTRLSHGNAFMARAETTIFDLVVTNFELAKQQKRAIHPGEVLTARDVLTDYRFLGICAAEEGNSSSYSNGSVVNRNLPRNIVAVMGGSAFNVLNYWDDQLTYGSNVGFILKGVSLKALVAHTGGARGTFNLDPSNRNDVQTLNYGINAPVVLQFVPWHGGPADTPNTKALMYVDQFGREEMGVYIPVGKFTQYHGSIGDRATIKRAWCSREAAVHAGTIMVLVSRNTPAY